MNIFVIYKSVLDSQGNITKVDIVECDSNEVLAARFTKFYNSQVPTDLRNKVQYNFIPTRIN